MSLEVTFRVSLVLDGLREEAIHSHLQGSVQTVGCLDNKRNETDTHNLGKPRTQDAK